MKGEKVQLLLAGLAAIALIGAIVLAGLDKDATAVWGVVGVLVGALTGQYLPAPRSGPK